jgi:purine-binding chemotaxis protein CheW
MTELFLIAHIAGRGVAIPTADVDSVVDIGEVVAVPGAEAALRGLTALRSRVITVIDTGVALGVGAMPADATRALITRVDGHFYAILVDSLEDVATFDRQPLSQGLALDRGWQRAGTGIVDRDGQPLLILDLAAVIPTLSLAA